MYIASLFFYLIKFGVVYADYHKKLFINMLKSFFSKIINFLLSKKHFYLIFMIGKVILFLKSLRVLSYIYENVYMWFRGRRIFSEALN